MTTCQLHTNFLIVWSQKISILPPQKGLEIPGRRGVSKTQKFKAMYEAKLEFPEGWGGGGGGYRANPFCGGMDIFWNHTLSTQLSNNKFCFLLLLHCHLVVEIFWPFLMYNCTRVTVLL